MIERYSKCCEDIIDIAAMNIDFLFDKFINEPEELRELLYCTHKIYLSKEEMAEIIEKEKNKIGYSLYIDNLSKTRRIISQTNLLKEIEEKNNKGNKRFFIILFVLLLANLIFYALNLLCIMQLAFFVSGIIIFFTWLSEYNSARVKSYTVVFEDDGNEDFI